LATGKKYVAEIRVVVIIVRMQTVIAHRINQNWSMHSNHPRKQISELKICCGGKVAVLRVEAMASVTVTANLGKAREIGP
jgi:hypothetical protein